MLAFRINSPIKATRMKSEAEGKSGSKRTLANKVPLIFAGEVDFHIYHDICQLSTKLKISPTPNQISANRESLKWEAILSLASRLSNSSIIMNP